MDKLDKSLDELMKERPSGGGKAQAKQHNAGGASRGSPYGLSLIHI